MPTYLMISSIQAGRFEPPGRNYPVARIQNAESTLLTGVETARPF
jgi:hypothetical protein